MNARCSLREAKEWVDDFEKNPDAIEVAEPNFLKPDPGFLDSDVKAQIKQALQNRKKIQAVKIYRDHTGSSLKEAKESVEQIEFEMKNSSSSETDSGGKTVDPYSAEVARSSKSGCMSVILALFVGGVILGAF